MANLTSPVGGSSALTPSTLATTLTGLRCDYASLVGLLLGAVHIPSGAQINTNSSAATLATAISAANAASTCPAATRMLAAAPAARRGLVTVASAPWASVAINIGVTSTAAAAAQVAAAVAAATAASFPRTIAAWAPAWGYSATTWVTDIGSPMALASVVTTTNYASFSPIPNAPSQGLTTSQQLGLGLGIALPIAAVIVVIALIAWWKKGGRAGALHSDKAAAATKAVAV